MKATVTAENLRAAMTATGHATRPGMSLAALGHVRIEATDGGLVFTTTDLDSRVSTTVPAEVNTAGVVLVSHGILAALAAKMPAGPVVVALNGTALAIRSGGASARLATMEPDLFPRGPTSDPGPSWTMTGEHLTAIAQRVAWATSDLASRPALMGVSIRSGDGRLTAAAADGAAMALQSWPLDAGPVEALVPPDAIGVAARILGPATEIVATLAGGWLVLASPGTTYHARLLSEQFPDVRQIIPAEQSRRAVVNRAALLEAVQFTNAVAHQATHGVTLRLGHDTITVSAESQAGESVREVPCITQGEPMAAKFNATKLVAVLRRIPTEDVVVGMDSGEETPCKFTPGTVAGGEEFLMLLMRQRSL